MRERRRIERLLNDIEQLVQKIKNYDKPLPEISKEILYKLFVLEAAISSFETINQAAFEFSSIDLDQFKDKSPSTSSNLTEDDVKLLARAQAIKEEAIRLADHLSEVSKENKKTDSNGSSSTTQPKKPSKRRTGGDKKWIPL